MLSKTTVTAGRARGRRRPERGHRREPFAGRPQRDYAGQYNILWRYDT